MADTLRPVDLARSAGVSTQTVREYEHFGFLPPVERTAHGYRRYEERHLAALQTARTLIAGFGWETARRIMEHFHCGELDPALHRIDACHARLHQQREEVENALALFTADSALTPFASLASLPAQPQRIAEVARRIGIRTSTLRYWEAQGLVRPTRDARSGYRIYDAEQIRRAYSIVFLRRAGYDLANIHELVERQSEHGAQDVLAAAQKQMASLRLQSRRCSAATSAAWQYWEEWAIQ